MAAENPADRVGEFYDRDSYRRAVEYAIAKGNRHGVEIPHWTPYLLRNSAATAIELEHGLDEAQAQLGHTSANMTKRYSKAQLKQREKLALVRVNPFEK
jgi:integrase